ncbi:general secretion pathway protein GspL [Ramlibacter sp. USB13]|uniref:General secretion pathway protein GspL n=1 Tax=Ramlibacter cellulosilyticus TaxID=2764187 RepID=A0A923MU54_9BURK|nr:type II secretion system protein GspL [Ramlibacter cellulosilyticus]MBC5785041.1 general secretion pathway protein GspL [Ramlibacter cellulosilyticus]
MSSLIVFLPPGAPTGTTEWAYASTTDGHALADHGRSPAALLPLPRGAGAEVVAVVPVQAVAWHRVELPKGIAPGTPRLRAALEGLLEEQLLDDTDSVHLALQPGVRGGDTAWVAVCDRAWLREALQALEAAGRPATRIVPEFAPEGSLSLTAIGEPEQATIVASSADGVLALPLSAATLPLLPAPPEDAPRLAEPAVAALAEQLLPQPWVLQQAAQRWLQSARSRWDLAQFEFASSSRARAMKKIATGWSELLRSPEWRPARWAAVLLLAVHLAGLNAWAWKENASLADKREAVQRILRETFPNVRVIVDAPVQMEREVAALRQQTGTASPRDLDALLAALAAALPPGRAPSAFDYANGQLRASGLALSPDELRTVAAQLRPLGYAATADGAALVLAAEDVR